MCVEIILSPFSCKQGKRIVDTRRENISCAWSKMRRNGPNTVLLFAHLTRVPQIGGRQATLLTRDAHIGIE
jgi:hypothetical protein